MLSIRQKVNLVLYSVGFIACFTLYGILQEKILRGRFGDEPQEDGKIGERFRMPITFSALQSIFYASCAKVVMILIKHPKNETHQGFYALNAIFYFLVKITVHYSLFWIPYSTQVIGRAVKPLPLMIFGFLLGGKRYKLQKVGFVSMIVCGVILFNLKDEYNERDGENPLLGNSLLFISLFIDGLMGASVDKMRQISKPTALNLMFYLNAWASGIMITASAFSNEIPKFFEFMSNFPEIIKFIVFVLIVGTVGQYFRSLMVTDFGPLTMSITATVMKSFNLFFSVLIFKNTLTSRQWCAAAIIFSILFIDAIFNTSSNNKHEKDASVNSKTGTTGEDEKLKERMLNLKIQN